MPDRTSVDKVMTKGVYSVTLDDTIRKADDYMKTEKIRHVPVLEGKKFIGLITERKIMEYTLRQIYEYDEKVDEIYYNKISDYQEIMTKSAHVIFPEDSVLKAIELFAKYKLECLPVVDWNHNLKGIITSIDVLLYFRKILIEEK